MTDAVAYILSARLVGNGEVDLRVRTDTPAEAISALRGSKPGVRFLARAAEQAGCTEPLLTLMWEFRADLGDFAAGEWTLPPVVDAIKAIGAIENWRFSEK